MMFSFYVFALLLLIEGSVLERFACIPSSPWLLGFSHGLIFVCTVYGFREFSFGDHKFFK